MNLVERREQLSRRYVEATRKRRRKLAGEIYVKLRDVTNRVLKRKAA